MAWMALTAVDGTDEESDDISCHDSVIDGS